MDAPALVLRLRDAGVQLQVDAGILIAAPASLLTDETRAAIRAQRDDLLRLVEDPDPRVTCATCVHARGQWCGAHPQSALADGYIGGIEAQAQHCPAWQGARS